MRRMHYVMACLAASGLVWPPHAVCAASPPVARDAQRPAAEVRDVMLGAGGTLRLRIVSRAGQPAAGVTLQLLDPSALELRQPITTGPDGAAHWQGLQGGVALLRLGHQLQTIRLWTAAAAPPAALQELLVVQEEPVVRGQQPFLCLFGQEPIMLAVLVAAAIAIPIAVHSSGSDAPTGS